MSLKFYSKLSGKLLQNDLKLEKHIIFGGKFFASTKLSVKNLRLKNRLKLRLCSRCSYFQSGNQEKLLEVFLSLISKLWYFIICKRQLDSLRARKTKMAMSIRRNAASITILFRFVTAILFIIFIAVFRTYILKIIARV